MPDNSDQTSQQHTVKECSQTLEVMQTTDTKATDNSLEAFEKQQSSKMEPGFVDPDEIPCVKEKDKPSISETAFYNRGKQETYPVSSTSDKKVDITPVRPGQERPATFSRTGIDSSETCTKAMKDEMKRKLCSGHHDKNDTSPDQQSPSGATSTIEDRLEAVAVELEDAGLGDRPGAVKVGYAFNTAGMSDEELGKMATAFFEGKNDSQSPQK